VHPAPETEPRFGRAGLLDFLLEVSDVTAQTLDLDELLMRVAEIVQRVIPSELFAILLYSERHKELRIVYGRGHREEVVRDLAIRLGEGITGAAAAARDAILVGDVRADPRYLNAAGAVRAELAVPMIARGKLVGVIDMQSSRVNAFSEQDSAMLRLIASRVGVAIDNARLYRRADRQNRTLRTLAALSHEFSSILHLDELLSRISLAVRRLVGYDAFSILLVDHAQKALRHRFSIRYDQRIDLDNIPLGKGITGAAVMSRQTIRVHDIATDPRYIPSHPGIQSEVAAPLIAHDEVIGVMDLESERLGYFTDDHVRALELLAPQIATSIENARLYGQIEARERRIQEDLRAARELQTLLLPSGAPEVSGLEISSALRAAREIAGDLYDLFEYPDGHTLIAFGDVSGKGAAAALYGALVLGLLRTLAPRRRTPAAILKALNEAVIERKVEARYVALLLLLWHPHSRRFTLANAGALPPLVCRRGELLHLRVEGVPVGLLPGREYEEVSLEAQAGDAILLFSDGVTDHRNPQGEEYGRRRLAENLRARWRLPARDLVREIFAEVDGFEPRASDDQTLMAVKTL